MSNKKENRKDRIKDWTGLYLKAARKIASGQEEFSCCAVATFGFEVSSSDVDARELYAKIMSPIPGWRLITRNIYEAHELDMNLMDGPPPKEVKDFRVLLLCMMAACWKEMVGYDQ